MTLNRTLATAALATTLLIGSAVAALAGPATIRHDTNLFARPGWTVTGSVDRHDHIWVSSCTRGYCYISDHGDRGWVRASAIDFRDYGYGGYGYGYTGYDGYGYGYGYGYDHHHHHHDHGGGSVCLGGYGGSFCISG